MGFRERQRTRGSVVGGNVYMVKPNEGTENVDNYGYTGNSWTQHSFDYTQPRPYVNDQPLVIEERRAIPTRVNGIVPYFNGWYYDYRDWNPSNLSGALWCPETPTFASEFWKTKALANMNPSRPVVDLPLFVFELKDFPRMLRHLGETLSKGLKGLRPVDVPEWHLAYSFGWKPLLSDLFSLVKLNKSIEERKAHLRAMEVGHRLKRTLTKGEVTRTVSSNWFQVWGLWDPILQADLTTVGSQRVWYTANAKLLYDLPDVRHDPEYSYIQALGLNMSAETLWNAIPWSWLIDYFVNVGDVLAAHRGYIPWKCTRMNLMCTSVAESTLTNVRQTGNVSVSVGSMKTSVKTRSVYVDPVPTVAFDPFLSGSQVAILGSLLTARSLRGIAK